MRNPMKQCVKWVKESFLEEAGAILGLALQDAKAFPKAGKGIPDRREKTGTGL